MDEVARELAAVQAAIGSGVEVAAFLRESLRACGGTVAGTSPMEADLAECPPAVKEAVGGLAGFRARFSLPVRKGELYLSRTHPLVEGLAAYTMDSALDPLGSGVARRCGVMRTDRVERRTTLLLVRFRFHIVTRRGAEERPLLAEDLALLAFEGSPQNAAWLEPERAEALLQAEPKGNVHADQAATFLQRILDDFDLLRPAIDIAAWERAETLLEAHRRVRTASRQQGISYRVEPQLPADVLGVYIYLPVL